MPDLTLLVLTDVHFLRAAQAAPSAATRRCDLGVELLRRAVKDARRRGSFDAVVLLGDMLDGGRAPGAEDDVAAFAQALSEAAGDVPRIVVPGNHDGDAAPLLSALGDRPGMHEVRGYRLYSFVDHWDADDVCRRPPEAMKRFVEDARAGAEKPLVVLQHNPLYPPIESDYPYMLSDGASIMAAYAEARVVLSLSGHYHPGQPACARDGVQYWTGGALADSPFRYAVVRLEGRRAEVEERVLKLPEGPPLYDVHAHTHYAYCSEDVTPAESIRRAQLFGLKGICLTEHSDQLYLTRQECEGGLALRDDNFWCAPRSEGSERMPRYRAEVEPLRSDYVKLGVEIELDCAGRPALRAAHAQGWDLLVGAVHWVPGGVESLSDREMARVFMENTEAVLLSGVHVLAHPFRFFRRYGRRRAKELYRPVAQMLARCGAAAEVNFHTNEPDVEFFAICVEEGVKIALGSDAHNLMEVGDFHPHLELLREAAGGRDVAEVMFCGLWA